MRLVLLFGLLGLAAGCDSSTSIPANANVGDCGTFPPIHNEAGCPESFAPAQLYSTCKEPGLRCQYPEKEFETPANICNGPLLVFCEAIDAGARDAGDAGDARAGEWNTPLP